MSGNGQPTSFEVGEAARSRVVGELNFSTVNALLPIGEQAINEGHAAAIDLAAVTSSDSSGLALLIEWLSIAKSSNHKLHYENVPVQLVQLARLSDVEELLLAS